MGQFLLALHPLLKRGLRFHYQQQADEQPFLRGQLDLIAQQRQPPGRQHRFHLRHDQLRPDCPENRLLRLAVERVCQYSQAPTNRRLAHELREQLHSIPPSQHIAHDLRAWRNDRLLADYRPVKPWCALILNQQLPLAVAGDWSGLSWLFPMERLFERTVTYALQCTLSTGAQLTAQAASHFLCQHLGEPRFRLQPDVLIQHGQRRWLLDCKWKRLNAHDHTRHYGLESRDFYQLLTYGQQYLNGQGELALIYPRCATFTQALAPFDLPPKLRLWVLPFNLSRGQLLGAERLGLPLSVC